MGDHVGVQLQVTGIYLGLTNHHPDQLSMAIPPCVGEKAMVFWPPSGKKEKVLRDSRPCNQDCWYTGQRDRGVFISASKGTNIIKTDQEMRQLYSKIKWHLFTDTVSSGRKIVDLMSFEVESLVSSSNKI